MGVDEEGNGELLLNTQNWRGWGGREELIFSSFLDPEFFLCLCFVFWIGDRKFWLNFSGYRQRHMEEKKILNIMKMILLRYYIAQ